MQYSLGMAGSRFPVSGIVARARWGVVMSRTVAVMIVSFGLVSMAEMAHAQPVDQEFLTRFNAERIELNTWGMVVLLGWAVGNIGVGTAGYFTTSGSTRYLHQGNAAWNLVNLAINDNKKVPIRIASVITPCTRTIKYYLCVRFN